jgi:hypothetical protein
LTDGRAVCRLCAVLGIDAAKYRLQQINKSLTPFDRVAMQTAALIGAIFIQIGRAD